MAYEIDYNDEQFQKIEADKNTAMKESDNTYDQMINGSDGFYQQQIDATNQWGKTQSNLQQEQTNFAIEQIEQQKEQARQDYTKEQTAAYVDWQKQSNDYGSNAEQMAASGLAHSGYSESSKVSMYNTYQNRVATARESYNKAVLNYDNAIKDARLQNNSALAEIAFNTLQTSLELSLQGFQYKNNLVLEKANAKREIDNTYYSRSQNYLAQLNTENALAENIRQYDTSLAENKRQYDTSLAENKYEFDANYDLKYDELEHNKEMDNKNYALNERAQTENERKNKADEDYKNAVFAWEKQQAVTSGSSSSSGSSKSSSGSSGNNQKKVTADNNTSATNTNPNNGVMVDGVGPLTQAALRRKLNSGEVIAYKDKNGNTKYKKNPNYVNGKIVQKTTTKK